MMIKAAVKSLHSLNWRIFRGLLENDDALVNILSMMSDPRGYMVEETKIQIDFPDCLAL